ncbi:DNA damage-binding protein 1 [Gonapodya sp. JEL0774]|nr:DNA damage-binding protein 1 [Gonapodya sp. JEL0774]
MYRLTTAFEPSLNRMCAHHGHILAFQLAVRGNLIAVADLMKSVSLLTLQQTGNPPVETLVEVARDYNTNWMTAVETLADDLVIGVDNSFNIFGLRRYAEAQSEDERRRLVGVGEWHVGDLVNRFKPGSLVMNLPDTEPAAKPLLLFGTVNGTIGIVASLTPERYALLQKIETNINCVLKPVGSFDHATWRSFCNDQRLADSSGFIDGDVVERFLDLTADQKEQVIEGRNGGSPVDVGVADLTKMIEDLARSCH